MAKSVAFIAPTTPIRPSPLPGSNEQLGTLQSVLSKLQFIPQASFANRQNNLGLTEFEIGLRTRNEFGDNNIKALMEILRLKGAISDAAGIAIRNRLENEQLDSLWLFNLMRSIYLFGSERGLSNEQLSELSSEALKKYGSRFNFSGFRELIYSATINIQQEDRYDPIPRIEIAGLNTTN